MSLPDDRAGVYVRVPTLEPSSGLHVVRRLLANEEVDGLVVGDADPFKQIVERVQAANGEGRLGAFRAELDGMPGADDLIALVLSGDPKAAPPPRPRALLAPIPELPPDAQPDPSIAADAGGWIDAYVAYARSLSPMTPSSFHESAALWLGATAIARRLVLPMAHARVYPNLYICWIAATTIYRKTTALAIPRDIAFQRFPHLLAPQEMSPEAFLCDLAGMEPTRLDEMSAGERALWQAERNFAGQRSLLLDEGSGLLAAAGRDYNAGLLEALLRLYDCDPRYTRSTRSQGRVTIRKAYLSTLMASTPRAMALHLGADRLWAMGWWPRFALLSPDTDRPAWEVPTADGPPGQHIHGPLEQLYARLPTRTWPEVAPAVTVTLGTGVFETWQAYTRAMSYELLRPEQLDERLFGTYGRLPTQVLKVATILAALDWQRDAQAPRIDLPHLHRAMEIAETWRVGAHRMIEQGSTAEENVKLSRILRQIGRHGLEGATFRDLRNGLRDIPVSEFQRLVDQAVSSEEVVAIRVGSGSAGGRPTTRYRIPIE